MTALRFANSQRFSIDLLYRNHKQRNGSEKLAGLQPEVQCQLKVAF